MRWLAMLARWLRSWQHGATPPDDATARAQAEAPASLARPTAEPLAPATSAVLAGTPDDSIARVAAHWSRHGAGTQAFSSEMFWLAIPAVHRRFQSLSTGGHSGHWVNYCVQEFLGDRIPVERMASLGCGTGQLERHLALFPAYRRCDAFDIAAGALELARREAAAEGLSGIHYEVGDINSLRLPERAYDAVWFNSSLHHVHALEEVCEGVARALKPEGLVFVGTEYVGPDRFALPDRQREAIRAAFRLIPERFRCAVEDGRAGPLLVEPALPDPAAVAAADPSEAVRSSAILAALERSFEIVVRHDAAGCLLPFVLQGIGGHFCVDDPEAAAVLEMLFRIEDTLIASGELSSDYALVIGRPRT